MSADPIGQRFFAMRHLESELDEALMEAFGATPKPGQEWLGTDPETWPCTDIIYDDYDTSFELWNVRDDAWCPTLEQLKTAFALGFSRCWICYRDGTERHCSATTIGDRDKSPVPRGSDGGKYLRAKLVKEIKRLTTALRENDPLNSPEGAQFAEDHLGVRPDDD